MPQAVGNAVISCICMAHIKYESNPVDWQWVVENGWCLLTKQDMERFEEMCKDGLLGPADMDSLKIGWTSTGQGMGTSALGMGSFW